MNRYNVEVTEYNQFQIQRQPPRRLNSINEIKQYRGKCLFSNCNKHCNKYKENHSTKSCICGHDKVWHQRVYESPNNVIDSLPVVNPERTSKHKSRRKTRRKHRSPPKQPIIEPDILMNNDINSNINSNINHQSNITNSDTELVNQIHQILEQNDKITSDLNKYKEKLLCSICTDREINIVLMPCGHAKFCSHCIYRWWRENKTCPCCRKQITAKKKFII